MKITLASEFLDPPERKAIKDSDDLARICRAASRDWQAVPTLGELQALLTRWLKHTPDPCGRPLEECAGCRVVQLNGAQATALCEPHDLESGCMGAMRVGSGKTLVSLLIPTVLSAKRPLLIVPASLRGKTLRESREYARHWRVAPMRVISYEWLANPKQLQWLNSYAPDVVVADEASAMKDSSSKCAKRLSKYLKANPQVRYVDLDGSTAGRSIKEFWHRLRWALKSRAPVPADPFEATAWAYALDEKVPPEARLDPAPLFKLSPRQVHEDPLIRARQAFRDRFTSTPGVVSTLEDQPDVGLRLWTSVLDLPEEANEAIRNMRKTWTTPDGFSFKFAVEMWRHARWMGCGLYQHWDPPAPEPWRFARSQWHKWVREKLAHSRIKDSSVHLVEAIRAGELDDGGLYAAWKQVEPTFTPNPVSLWVHDRMLIRCAEWLEKHPRGLVWTEIVEFGERLEALTGVPYFREEGKDKQGRPLDKYKGGPAIASVNGCKKGLNLQFAFSDNLFPSPMSKGSIAEQVLGRTHREGQEASVVTGEFVLTCKESYQCLAQAIRDAYFAQQTLGQPQKLCYADRDFRDVDSMDPDNKDTWNNIGV